MVEHERDHSTTNGSRDGGVKVFCIQYRCIYIYLNGPWNGNFWKGTYLCEPLSICWVPCWCLESF
jgi:hypothetical protein